MGYAPAHHHPSLTVEDVLSPDRFLLRVRCSKGTYVRTRSRKRSGPRTSSTVREWMVMGRGASTSRPFRASS